ncbi:aldo/keto reductase [bacterium]|nr:aldo/keto reductase [bacterium]MDB4809775.1 aldo/keto reductase [bacterium]
MIQLDSTPSVALGLWPLAGITTVGVTNEDAEATITAAINAGITTFDTAFSYGYQGESDRLLGRFIKSERDRYCIIGKVGQRWTNDRQRVIDAHPTTITNDAETSLKRMGIESLDLLMLHSPDPEIPIEESAASLCRMVQQGRCRSIGVCNVQLEQFLAFHKAVRAESIPCDAIQVPLNLLQQESLQTIIPNCYKLGTHTDVYWTLMKGLLAGKISRDHEFAPGDSRPSYEIFRGEARARAHDVVDALETLGREVNRTTAQLAVGWTLSQRGVRHALVGARRPEQVKEIAGSTPLSNEVLFRIDDILR